LAPSRRQISAEMRVSTAGVDGPHEWRPRRGADCLTVPLLENLRGRDLPRTSQYCRTTAVASLTCSKAVASESG
jgi:hypothetical protein